MTTLRIPRSEPVQQFVFDPNLTDPPQEQPKSVAPSGPSHDGLSNTDHSSILLNLPPGLHQVPGSPVLQVTNEGALRLPADAASAPRALDFLAPFKHVFSEAWKNTTASDREHGFLFSLDQDLRVRLVNFVKGENASVKLDLDLPPGEVLGGIFHTHPDGPNDRGNFTSFSGADTVNFLASKDPMSLVETGSPDSPSLRHQYLYLRTRDTHRPDGGPEAFRKEWNASVDVMSAPQSKGGFGLSFADAIHLTNARFAKQYGYAYYEGHGGRFRKVDLNALLNELLPPPPDVSAPPALGAENTGR